jgi:ABC-type amino acid transport substrate-binding protein
MRRPLLSLLLAFGVAGAAAAQAPLRVGVVERPPFAAQPAEGLWHGLAIDLWRSIAEAERWTYELEPLEPEAAAAALEAGRIDVALGLDATAALEARAEVVHPFYVAAMGVARPRESDLLRVARGLMSWDLLGVIASLSVLLLAVGALVWLAERRRNDAQFHRDPMRGLGDGFWWAGVTLTTIGYGDKAPATLTGRAIAMLWMLMGLAVSASLTAAVIAATDTDRAGLSLPGDLRGERLGARDGSGAARYLEALDLDYEVYRDAAAGLSAVAAGELDLFLGAAPALKAARDGGGLALTVTATRLDPHHVAMATAEGSALAETLDRRVLERVAGPGWPDLVARHLPTD